MYCCRWFYPPLKRLFRLQSTAHEMHSLEIVKFSTHLMSMIRSSRTSSRSLRTSNYTLFCICVGWILLELSEFRSSSGHFHRNICIVELELLSRCMSIQSYPGIIHINVCTHSQKYMEQHSHGHYSLFSSYLNSTVLLNVLFRKLLSCLNIIVLNTCIWILVSYAGYKSPQEFSWKKFLRLILSLR